MRRNATSPANRKRTVLHLWLVLAIFLYLYSPLFDHWLGHNNVHAATHTHVYLSSETVEQLAFLQELALLEKSDEHALHAHDEGFLCFLDIESSVALMLDFDAASMVEIVHDSPLTFDLNPSSFKVAIVYLATIDPPPRLI